MTYEVVIDGHTRSVEVERRGEAWSVRVDGGPALRVDLRRPQPGVFSMLVDRHSYDVGVVRRDGGWEVDIQGTAHACKVLDPRRRELRLGGAAAEGLVESSMPGRIAGLLVAEGDEVEAGQPVLVIEAMKMENELKAPLAGRVLELFVQEGDAVEAHARLLRVG